MSIYEQQLIIVREIGDRRGEGNALGNLGIAYADLGETRKAIEFYEQRCLYRRARSATGAAKATPSWNMALALDELGEREQAIAHAEAALKILKRLKTQTQRRCVNSWRSGRVGETKDYNGLRMERIRCFPNSL